MLILQKSTKKLIFKLHKNLNNEIFFELNMCVQNKLFIVNIAHVYHLKIF